MKFDVPHNLGSSKIAIIWDFDRTMIPNYMQRPLFRAYDIDEEKFWEEVNNLGDFYRANGAFRVAEDSLYLNHIIRYVRRNHMPGLTNAKLRALGGKINFFPGMPEFLRKVKDAIEGDSTFQSHGLTVEHFIVSTGIREMILGSAVASDIPSSHVWACEFLPGRALATHKDADGLAAAQSDEIAEVGYTIDNTSKTRAIFEINKGSYLRDGIHVNDMFPHGRRHIPFQNMIYVADGPSDVPVFSLVNQYGGTTYAVYNPNSLAQFQQAFRLQSQGRIHGFGPAEYSDDTHTSRWILTAARNTAHAIVSGRQHQVSQERGAAPVHIVDYDQRERRRTPTLMRWVESEALPKGNGHE